jgi:hypothetical protein
MTGDTANGRSMSVIRRLLPWNSNLAMAHAAAIPNTVFTGTTIAAVSSVSLIAACGVGIGEAAEVGAHALAERRHDDDGERARAGAPSGTRA